MRWHLARLHRNTFDSAITMATYNADKVREISRGSGGCAQCDGAASKERVVMSNLMRTGWLAKRRRGISLLPIATALFWIALLAGAPARANVIINPTYDSTVSSLTSGSITFAQVKSAFEFAAAQFQNTYADNITINIDVAASSNIPGVGSSAAKLQVARSLTTRSKVSCRPTKHRQPTPPPWPAWARPIQRAAANSGLPALNPKHLASFWEPRSSMTAPSP